MTSANMSHRVDRIASGLLRRAASRAPGELSERLDEEWQAFMADLPGRWARLRFALGCCWATTVIAREQCWTLAPAGGATATVASFLADNVPGFSRRSAALVAVAALHVGVFFAFIYGLTPPLFKPQVPPALEPRILEPTPPPRVIIDIPRSLIDKHVLVEPPRPQPIPDLPPLTEPVFKPQPTASDHGNTERTPSGSDSSLPPPRQMTRQIGGPGAGFPNTADYYPSAAIHLGEHGFVVVQACVDVKGRLTRDPTIVTSAGSRLLDEGALRLAKAGSGHYRASLDNGAPVDSCYPFKVVFALGK